ncbi:MAG: MBL fold metallo-hydrolase [Candidatus Methanoperedens sp.]|nr:MBL fold metallo-hydrolase [Candidatus Methanoperedens sp.]
MRLKILYDNEPEEGFVGGWGFSCLIETGKRKILFDTGWDGNVLLYNMGKFGIEKEGIDTILISHAHWDHLGGITHILHPDVNVYVPNSFSVRLKKEISKRAELIEIKGPKKITPDVYTTGEMGNIKEQAMVLKTNKGISVVTGCAHTGLENLINTARNFGELYGVIGGFHNFNNFECMKDTSLIVPCHCTRHKNELKQSFPDQYMECKTGSMIEI